ncbi:MAG: protein-L-isoaspartate(D-aspartate) O-methyltransferase [Candidatus Micrarchaeota archaeon]|nr:protein-L-isoaspartate(D-aspartate) O-methyltransferase [Candidatus Micrarchaeota archaeon]
MDLERLIAYLKRTGVLKSRRVEEALRKYPRELFVRDREKAYIDSPLPIGYGQTISQPSTVVIMTEALCVEPGQKILEIGSGSGWQAALLSYLTGPKGKVYTVERIPELAEFARKNLEKVGANNVKVILGDGSKGLPEFAPYDRIIVTAACREKPEFVDQLKSGGRLVAPVGFPEQRMLIVDRTENGFTERFLPGWFIFVPLIS